MMLRLFAIVFISAALAPLAGARISAPPALRVDGSTAEATGPSGAMASYNVKADDPSTGPLAATCDTPAGTAGTGDFTVTSQFPLGTTAVTCTTTDSSGTVWTKSANVVVQDTTPPSIAPTANITSSTTNPAGTTVHYNVPSATDLVDGSDPVTCTPASDTNFAVGTTTVSCTSTDAHQNTGTSSFTVTVTVVITDTTPPVVTVPADVTVNANSVSGATVTYTASATDNVDGPLTPSCNPASGSTFPIGTTTVRCSATDAHGNTGTGSFTVTVVFVDTTPPTFSGVPANRVIEANGPSGSIVNYATPTASDAVDGPIAIVICSPISGSMFPLGTTAVTCRATDSKGNTGTASFSVNVVDTTKPTLVVPSDRSVYADTPAGISAQSSGASAFLAGASAVDIVDLHPAVSNDAPAFFSIGTHIVTFSARDASGNSVSKTAVLEVLPMPPTGTPPLPIPPAGGAPPNVQGLKAEPGDRRIRLSWQLPNGVQAVVISRSLAAGGESQVVYTGSAKAFTDRGVVNGLEYRYLVVSVDKDGRTSAGVAIAALPRRTLLTSPKDGAHLRKAPKLVWVKNSEAAYYNVQLFRGNLKILSAWPVRSSFVLKTKWKYDARRYRLSPGLYRWYVWPGFGARKAVDYGEMLGFSSFQIVG
jgi:hypothetical protein